MASALAAEAVPVTTSQELADIPLELLDVGENVRVDPGNLEELTASIAELGVLQPIRAIGPDVGGRYRAVWGQRRILASIAAGLDTIPALVESAADVDKPGARRSIEQLAENLQRKDLNPIEEAVALREVLAADKALTQADLGKRLGRHPSWIANTLGLLKAPAKVQELVRSEELSIAHAKAISGLPVDAQVRLAKDAVERGQSAHALEESAKWERRTVNERGQGEKLTKAAAERGLAALEKAGTPKDARLFVYAEHWQIQDAEVRKAIKAAGYKVDEGWTYGGDRWAKCDCTALQLRIRDGDGSTISVVCVKDAHRTALEKERSAKQREKQAADDADRKRLAAFVRAAMPAELNPTVGRLLLRALDGYYGKTWTEYSKLSDAAVLKAIAEKLTSEQILGGASYNGDSKRVPVKTLIRELGGVEENAPTEAEKPKHPRRKPPATDQETALAKAEAPAP